MITLRGIKELHEITTKRIDKMIKKDDIKQGASIQVAKGIPTTRSNVKIILHYDIQHILNIRIEVFKEIPIDLPLNHGFHHNIKLEIGSKLVIIFAYQYPQIYKDEINKIIKQLLKIGHIQPRTIPFTSSIVLVKKDGMMIIRIDYRDLNKNIIKNRYPIP